MKKGIYFLGALAALLLLFSSGCAHILEFREPEEFRGKKQIEDPPLTKAPLERKEAIG